MSNSNNSEIINLKSKILILMGPPGSGKGTQAKKLAAFLNYQHLSSGDLIRALLSDPAAEPLEKAEAEKSRQGVLAGDWLIYRLVFREIEKFLAAGQGVILDGAIRNLTQAQEFVKFFTEKNLLPAVQVVWVALSDDEAWERLTKRRVCGACGEIIPYSLETKVLAACPKCGGQLVIRPDDTPEVLRERFVAQGNAAQKPILDFFRQPTVGAYSHTPIAVTEVDGRADIETVFGEIMTRIRE